MPANSSLIPAAGRRWRISWPALIEALAGALDATLEDETLVRSLFSLSVLVPEGAERGPGPGAAPIRAEHESWGRFIRAARMEG